MAKTAARQTSRKAGVTSTAQKLAGTRHGFETHPASRKAAGAYGSESGRARKEPGTATRKKGMAAALGAMKTTSRRARTAK